MSEMVKHRAKAIAARHRSNTSNWKANQRLQQQLARKPAEDYPVIGQPIGPWCSHQIDTIKHPEHDCREYENAKRAERGAPPL